MARPPTTAERLVRSSVDELAPHRSLAAIEAAGKFIFASVAVVGTITSGLGVAVANEGSASLAWALPAIVSVVVSLVCATLAITPSLRTLRPGNQIDAATFFSDQIKLRGGLVRVAGVTFALALLLAALPVFVEAARTRDHIVLRAEVASGGGATATATVAREGVAGILLTAKHCTTEDSLQLRRLQAAP